MLSVHVYRIMKFGHFRCIIACALHYTVLIRWIESQCLLCPQDVSSTIKTSSFSLGVVITVYDTSETNAKQSIHWSQNCRNKLTRLMNETKRINVYVIGESFVLHTIQVIFCYYIIGKLLRR